MNQPFCTECPDREACSQGAPCDVVLGVATLSKPAGSNAIVNERAATYGDVHEMYTRSAHAVSAVLGVEVLPWQVPLIMVGLKLVRTSITPDYSDNSDDIDGYVDIFRTLIGPDMITASSAAEYQLKKNGSTT